MFLDSADIDTEAIEDCFRSYIWKPPEGFTKSECQELCAKLDFANRATSRFLDGEINEEEFLDIKEWAHGNGEMDGFIESAKSNLDLVL
jgi:hypothetical protein